MKTTSLLTCASLLAIASQAQPAEAATSPADEQTKEALREAICQQNWQGAVHLSSRLMASYNITPEHRQNLVDWRYRFSQYAASGTHFDHIPNCEGVAPARPVVKATTRTVAPTAKPEQNVNQTKTDLRQAICQQEWQDAVILSSRLMASDSITPEHRQNLVIWRRQFSQYAASGTRFDHIPNCEGVSGSSSRPALQAPTRTPETLPLN